MASRALTSQVYFTLTLYSYAAHLRQSTYHQLPRTSRSKASQLAHPITQGDVQVLHEIHDEIEHELALAEADAGADDSASQAQGQGRKGSYGASRETPPSPVVGKGKGRAEERG